ncbi:unnamed protein product [Closterium sp. NIES-64]|nr:unnamed protein product [Closterium sp. NIES-64]
MSGANPALKAFAFLSAAVALTPHARPPLAAIPLSSSSPPLPSFLSLLYAPSNYLSIRRCSSLTSLTLGNPKSSTLSSLAFSSPSLVSSSSSSSSSSSPLASFPPSSLRTSLTSLTIHSPKLQGSLASLAFVPSLSSLSLHSCTVDPYELSSLSHSLHSLTHLIVHSCPLVSSRSLIPILQANPALTSLSLHGTTYRLFACTALRSLSVEGIGESSCSVFWRGVSLDGIAGMLVWVEQTGGRTGGEAGGDGGGEAGGEAGGDGGLEGGANAWERGRGSAPAAAAEAAVLPKGSNKQCGKYVDIRTEAEAAQADKLVAVGEVPDFIGTAAQTSRAALSEVTEVARAGGESAVARIIASFGKIRFWISVCRSCSDIREYNAVMDWEEKLMRSAGAVAGRATGYFATEVNGGEEVRDGEEEQGFEIMDSTPADEALPERVLGGERSGAVETHVEAMRRLDALVDMLQKAACGLCDSSRTMRKPPGLTAASVRSGAVAAAVADGRAALHGVEGGAAEAADGRVAVNRVGGGAAEAADGGVVVIRVGGGAAEAADGRVAVNKVGGGAAEGLQQAESALEDGGPSGPAAGEAAAGEAAAGEAAAGEAEAGEAAAGNAAAEFPRIRPMSFQSIARAAVFGQLKRLALLFCSGLEEEWLELLAACVQLELEEFTVQHSDKFSDAVVVGSRLGTLTSLTVVMCDKVMAAGIGGVLRSFPRLRYLKVEVGKVSERVRRELIRAGVIVRGVRCI